MDNDKLELKKELFESSKRLAATGLSLIVVDNAKRPVSKNGSTDATTDTELISRWLELPQAQGIAICTGQYVVIDIDIDKEKGKDGFDYVHKWESEHGELAPTVSWITGRGGEQRLYKTNLHIHNCNGRDAAGNLVDIDIRGKGGYAIVPPSVHPNGNRYVWQDDIDEINIAELRQNEIDFILSLGCKIDEYNNRSNYGTNKRKICYPIKEGSRNNDLYNIACSEARILANKGVLDLEDTVFEKVYKINETETDAPLSDNEVQRIVSSACSFVDRERQGEEEYRVRIQNSSDAIPPSEVALILKRNKNGGLLHNRRNCEIVIERDENLAHKFKFNILANDIYICGRVPWSNKEKYRELTNADYDMFLSYLSEAYELQISMNTLVSVLNVFAHREEFHPVQLKLESLPAWDGKEHAMPLFRDYLGVENTKLNRAMIRYWMLGGVYRAYEAGCKFDYMLMIIGKQGIGKSFFFSKLAMSPLWHTDAFSTIEGDKASEKLRGMWLIEMNELQAFKSAKGNESIKAFLTSRVDNYRAPYERKTEQRPRQCFFVGTSNDSLVLTDSTGNRRFLPILVDEKKIKKDMFGNSKEFEAEIEQAWAEIFFWYKTEHPDPVLPKDMDEVLEKQREDFTESDWRIGKIQQWLNETNHTRVCAAMIWDECLEQTIKPNKRDTKEINAIMRQSITGWQHVHRQRCGKYGIQDAFEAVCENVRFDVRFDKDLEQKIGFESVSENDAEPF